MVIMMKNFKKVLIVTAFLMLINVFAPAANSYINNPGGGISPQSDLPFVD
jgi:hypothetical protein